MGSFLFFMYLGWSYILTFVAMRHNPPSVYDYGLYGAALVASPITFPIIVAAYACYGLGWACDAIGRYLFE